MRVLEIARRTRVLIVYYPLLDNDSVVGFLTERMADLLIELGDIIGRKVTLPRSAI